MKKAIKTLNRLQDIFTAALVAAFIIIILFATICRYFAISTLKWPDELARYLMMWMVFIGCGAAARNGSHFSIDIIYLIIPKKYHNIITVISTGLMDFAMLYVVYLSFNMTMAQIRMGQVSSAMHIPMWIMYLTIPVGCALNALQGTAHAVNKCMENRKELAEGGVAE